MGHTKGYIQVLVIAPEWMLGASADVKIISAGRWSVFGEILDPPAAPVPGEEGLLSGAFHCRPSSSLEQRTHGCNCSGEPAAVDKLALDDPSAVAHQAANNLSGLFRSVLPLRRRKVGARADVRATDSTERVTEEKGNGELGAVDWVLIGGAVFSLLTIVFVLIVLILKMAWTR